MLYTSVLFVFLIGFVPMVHAADCAAEPTTADQIQCLQDEIVILQNRVNDLEDWQSELTTVMYVDTNGDVVFNGTNVHIRKGWGNTWDDPNGLGNLIIGYNEVSSSGGSLRTGSHNLVIGPYHNYTDFGSIVHGYSNDSFAEYSFLLGGSDNIVEGGGIAGGIIAGYNNTVSGSGDHAVIVSGSYNNATQERDVSIGGSYSTVSGKAAVIVNGRDAEAMGDDSVVVGGRGLIASGSKSLAIGGDYNIASGNYSVTLGGIDNESIGLLSVTSGGRGNRAIGYYSSVNGGRDNDASGSSSSILGGYHNDALHNYSVVLGNRYIFTSADYDIAPH